jgi:hypothetical protein
MGRYTFIIVFFGILGLIAAVVPSSTDMNQGFMQMVEPSDSTELKQHDIYICRGHYFEWCNEASSCGYCNEALEQINLWEYYKILECEDCQKFFNENYTKFIETEL